VTERAPFRAPTKGKPDPILPRMQATTFCDIVFEGAEPGDVGRQRMSDVELWDQAAPHSQADVTYPSRGLASTHP
jgi:hypothetical protein